MFDASYALKDNSSSHSIYFIFTKKYIVLKNYKTIQSGCGNHTVNNGLVKIFPE